MCSIVVASHLFLTEKADLKCPLFVYFCVSYVCYIFWIYKSLPKWNTRNACVVGDLNTSLISEHAWFFNLFLTVFSKRFQKIWVFLHCSPHIHSMVLEFKSTLVRFSISRFCGLAILLRWWVIDLGFDWTCSTSDGGCPSIILPFKAFCCEPADTSGNDEWMLVESIWRSC